MGIFEAFGAVVTLVNTDKGILNGVNAGAQTSAILASFSSSSKAVPYDPDLGHKITLMPYITPPSNPPMNR